MSSTDGLMVSVSGIRGRVAAGLTPEVVATYASAFGAWALRAGKSKNVVVGRDSRVSGPMFHRVVVSSLQSVGCDVIDIGLTTTPTCQLAVEHHHAAGGLMISASHHPPARVGGRGGGATTRSSGTRSSSSDRPAFFSRLPKAPRCAGSSSRES